MRRIIAVLLGLCLLSAICPIFAVSALTDELLVNGDFEAGNASGFFAYGPSANTDFGGDYAHIGAIRWDAWYTHDGNPTSVISQVERSLSPAEYHYRTPFFGEITEDGKVIIPAYTQDVFDREMVYAADAGIDYFAYVWYNDDMRAARDFHLTSAYANEVKMAACLDGNAIGKDYARREITALFSQDLYMTVSGGRPLMYYFGEAGNLAAIRDDINYYRQYCAFAELPAPYAVIHNVDGSTAVAYGADASSAYAVGGSSTYAALTAAAKRDWNTRLRDGVAFVPSVTCGWSPKPRFDNPVSWTTVPENSWSEDATPDELYAHLTEALRYMQGAKVTSATNSNTVLIYAWNEHDEGGWICPTLAVDENGAQLYDDNGQKRINDERIRSTKRAIADFKSRMTGQSDTTAAETTAPTPDTSVTTALPVTDPVQGTTVDDTHSDTSSTPSAGGCQSLVGLSVCLALVAGGVCLLRRRRDF